MAIKPDELVLRYAPALGRRTLSFTNDDHGRVQQWRDRCRQQLQTLLALRPASYRASRLLREEIVGGVVCQTHLLELDAGLTIPAYLLRPAMAKSAVPVVALHGHGEVEALIDDRDDYHHRFGLELAKAGRIVLCPALRGFGCLYDLAAHAPGRRLDYWRWGQHMAYSAVTDAVQRGGSLIGDTVADLLAWEQWLAAYLKCDQVDVAGISYGGDLALTYPVFSSRVRSIYASGTLGSFESIFSQGYNAPAHLIPGVLNWMDRSDIAGLNAPRPIVLHYGDLDRPSPGNFSASLNGTVEQAVKELRNIYAASNAEGAVQMHVTPGGDHAIDVEHLLSNMAG